MVKRDEDIYYIISKTYTREYIHLTIILESRHRWHQCLPNEGTVFGRERDENIYYIIRETYTIYSSPEN